MSPQPPSRLDLDILLLIYSCSDQWGNVDIAQCKSIGREKLGINEPVNFPNKVTQDDFDELIGYGIVPDTNFLLRRFKCK